MRRSPRIRLPGALLEKAWKAEAKVSASASADLSRQEVEYLHERWQLENQLRRKRELERTLAKAQAQMEDLEVLEKERRY